MKVIVAKTAGFCFGVRNAIEIAEKTAGAKAAVAAAASPRVKALTLGPLIHNQAVIHDLEKQGIFAVNSPEEVPEGVPVIIRAHGVGRAVYERLQERGLEVVDATCPYVKKIHRIAEEANGQCRKLVIAGDPNHPEVQGICGWFEGDPIILKSPEDAPLAGLDKGENYTLVAQTTYNLQNFTKIVEFFETKEYNIFMRQTICMSTMEHQKEALELASQCDAMIVIGGKQSSNTRKLYDLCSSVCRNTFLIEGADELRGKQFGTDVLTVGITAGASTPDYIIQEVFRKMSEKEVFEEMLDESLHEIHNGYVVEGTVVQVGENEIVLNIGYKCDGTMTKQEFGGTDAPLSEQVHVGDKMEVKVVRVGDSEVTLSRRRLVQDKAYEELENAEKEGTVLSGKVVEVQDNGIVVKHGDSKVFIPASLCDVRRIDLNTLKDKDVNFKVIRIQRKRNRILGDRKSVVAEERAALREETIQKLVPGARLEGTVKNITNYCAFIDLGGIDGMLHISEMGWNAVRNPNRYVKEGETIEVGVKSYDPETGRISLTTKFPETNPWNGAEEKYAIGNIVTGKVVRFADFGAFVELEKGIDALVHISQMSHNFVKNPADVLEIGQEVEAKVIDFNAENKRISLSLKELEAPAEELPAEEYPEEYVEEEYVEDAPEAAEEFYEEELPVEEEVVGELEDVAEEAAEPVEEAAEAVEEAAEAVEEAAEAVSEEE